MNEKLPFFYRKYENYTAALLTQATDYQEMKNYQNEKDYGLDQILRHVHMAWLRRMRHYFSKWRGNSIL